MASFLLKWKCFYEVIFHITTLSFLFYQLSILLRLLLIESILLLNLHYEQHLLKLDQFAWISMSSMQGFTLVTKNIDSERRELSANFTSAWLSRWASWHTSRAPQLFAIRFHPVCQALSPHLYTKPKCNIGCNITNIHIFSTSYI